MMVDRWRTVAELPQFVRDVAAAGVSEGELKAIVDSIAADPFQGDEVRGSGGVRKVRFAGRGKGKSGGYRVMAAYIGEDAPVYLLALLSKGERGTFTVQEIEAMHKATTLLKKTWRTRRLK
jgi:hypothetical protein